MKAYTFTLAPLISDFLTEAGYDAGKLVNAVESNGNDNLTAEMPTQKTKHGFTPARVGSRVGKPASSTASVNTQQRFIGKGNTPEQFAAWHDATVALAGRYGALTAIPLPVTLRTWLDAKFKAAPVARGNGDVKKVAAPAVPV